MAPIIEIPISEWSEECTEEVRDRAARALEEGNVVLFPRLAFWLLAAERSLLSPRVSGSGKNISFDTSTGRLRGTSIPDAEAETLKALMRRYATACGDLLFNVFPRYRKHCVIARTSFRPVEIAGRSTSWRKDDSRLHVDSFPSSPVQGRRILRIFSNVNPEGRARAWRLGEPFEGVARRYLDSLSDPVWGAGRLLQLCGITKTRRSAYDHFMLQIHDRMKADREYQSQALQSTYDFPAGTTWMVFTDQVSHAATKGQHVLEQTFYLPGAAMLDPARAPLRILERLSGRKLA
jgi:hypothetical protein